MKKILLFGSFLCHTILYADTYTTFNFTYSGAQYGNFAQATGFVTLDTTALNPSSLVDIFPGNSSDTRISALQITVSGAASGNGTFSYNDFWRITWSTEAATLNVSTDLLGQATPSGPWGPTVNLIGGGPAFVLTGAGHFDLTASGPGVLHPGGPDGVDWFTLRTANGTGDKILLTSFTPVPEPSALALWGCVLTGLYVSRKRK